jgi:sugar lactone lactonase YvrE
MLALAALACSLGGDSDTVALSPIAADDLSPTRIAGGGVPLTDTPTITPSPTPTLTFTPTYTLTPTITPSPTDTSTPTPTLTPSNTPTPTPGLLTLTPVPSLEATAIVMATVEAPLQPTAGWGCGDFPCEDDIDGFLDRISVPDGFTLSHLTQLPGQPVSITYGPDGRLYAALIMDGAQMGAIAAVDAASGAVEWLVEGVISPGGLAFRPGTDILYYTARTAPDSGGAIYSLQPGDPPRLLRSDLPCCFTIITGQPNGLTFGPDGFLYVATGALSDHTEAAPNLPELYEDPAPWEGAILRLPPDGSTVEVYADGLRDPIDLAFTADGTLYATDTGLIIGPGDRLMRITPGGQHGWPFWRERGCLECPVIAPGVTPVPDWVTLPFNASPRGLTAYHAGQFPTAYHDNLFMALWNRVEGGQRIVRVRNLSNERAQVSAFVTGLIRPVDVTVAPDGALVVADYIYGHVWRVAYGG